VGGLGFGIAGVEGYELLTGLFSPSMLGYLLEAFGINAKLAPWPAELAILLLPIEFYGAYRAARRWGFFAMVFAFLGGWSIIIIPKWADLGFVHGAVIVISIFVLALIIGWLSISHAQVIRLRKTLVWNISLGRNETEGKCQVCGETINVRNFKVAKQIEFEEKGDASDCYSLKPVCKGCKSALGGMSIMDFKSARAIVMDKIGLKLKLLGVIFIVLTLISLALPWWEVTASHIGSDYSGYDWHESIYLWGLQDTHLMGSDFYLVLSGNVVLLCLIVISGILGMIAIRKSTKRGKLLLKLAGTFMMLSLLFFGWSHFVAGPRELSYYGIHTLDNPSFGFWFALVAAIMGFVINIKYPRPRAIF
jgi:hypothetical protein